MENGNGHVDPDAGVIRVTVKYDLVSKQVGLNSNSRDLMAILGVLEMGKIAATNNVATRPEASRIALPVGPKLV